MLGLWSLAAFAGEVEGTASGFVELRNVWYVGVDGKPWLLVERFRPTFEADLSKRVHLEATIEFGLQQGRFLQDEFNRTLLESALNEPLVEGTPDTALDFAGCTLVEDESANGLFHIDGRDDYAAVDRLFADVYLGKADVRAGRQAVQWGNALLVHPADPFPEVLFLEPWRPRAGVNAARMNVQLGDASALTVLAGADDALVNERFAGRLTANFLETDLSVIGAWRGETESGIVGLDVKGTLELGFWVEGSWHLQPEAIAGSGTFEDDFAEIAAGVDYSFPLLDQFVIGAQYYYNGNGSPEPDQAALAGRFRGAVTPPVCADLDGSLLATSAVVDPFAPIFVGRDYGMFYAAIAVNDRWSGNAALVQNLNDGTGIAVPTVSYKPAGWSEISLSAQLPYAAWGEGGELRPGAKDTLLQVPVVGVNVPLELGGLVPEATFIVWTRASF